MGLQLICNKNILKLAIEKKPEIKKSKPFALIAKINEIKIEHNMLINLTNDAVIVGYGNCLAILNQYDHYTDGEGKFEGIRILHRF